MRYVDCGKEPVSLQRLQESGNQDWNPQGEYSDLIQGLGQPFEFFALIVSFPVLVVAVMETIRLVVQLTTSAPAITSRP